MGIINDLKIATGISKNPTDSPTPPPQSPLKKILIVEDELALGEALEIKLKSENYDVVHVTNGFRGLKSLANQKPDLILLDIMMPIMDGKEMLNKMREMPEYKDIPVIVLSNSGSTENMDAMRTNGGAVDFLIKSNVSLQEIVDKVKTHAPNH